MTTGFDDQIIQNQDVYYFIYPGKTNQSQLRRLIFRGQMKKLFIVLLVAEMHKRNQR
ncbi:MAG: hypothetical protein R2877_07555 [Bdellovibrionota bacterium]